MNTTEGLHRPYDDNDQIRPLPHYARQSVLQSTVYTKKCFIIFAVYPDHPLTLNLKTRH